MTMIRASVAAEDRRRAEHDLRALDVAILIEVLRRIAAHALRAKWAVGLDDDLIAAAVARHGSL